QWNAFERRGTWEAWVGLQLPAPLVPAGATDKLGGRLLDKLEIGVQAHFAGAGGTTYRGLPDEPSGALDLGFPLPLDKITGDAIYARDPRRLRPWRLGVFDLAGEDGASLVRASGVVEAHPV